MNGFRKGKKLPKSDVARRIAAFNSKVEEYSTKSLDELKELYPTLKGSYKMACEQVVMLKLNQARVENAEEASKAESLPEDIEHNPSIKEQ